MKKITIFYSAVETYPFNRVDITELFLNQLKDSGIEQIYYTKRGETGPKVDFIKDDVRYILPKKIVGKTFTTKVINKLFYWTEDIRSFVKYRNKVNLIQYRDKTLVPLVALIYCKIFKLKFVYWLSYSYPEHYFELAKFESNLKKIHFQLLGHIHSIIVYKIILKHADFCFFQSKKMQELANKKTGRQSNSLVVPMGLTDEMLKFKTTTQNKKNLVISLGSLTRVRRISTFIEIISLVRKDLPDVQLILIGGEDDQKDKLIIEKSIIKHNAHKFVKLTGHMEREKALKLTSRATLCLSLFHENPALITTSPSKLIEYMALSKPILANKHPEQSAIVDASQCGIIEDWDVCAMSKAVIRLLTDSNKATQMGKSGREWVIENRGYDKIASSVLNAYISVIKNSN